MVWDVIFSDSSKIVRQQNLNFVFNNCWFRKLKQGTSRRKAAAAQLPPCIPGHRHRWNKMCGVKYKELPTPSFEHCSAGQSGEVEWSSMGPSAALGMCCCLSLPGACQSRAPQEVTGSSYYKAPPPSLVHKPPCGFCDSAQT